MAQAGKFGLNYRCPRCFMRDLDIDLNFDPDLGEYRCPRCCFHGNESEVLRLNEEYKGKYGRLRERVVDFGADNEPPKFKKHEAGEQ